MLYLQSMKVCFDDLVDFSSELKKNTESCELNSNYFDQLEKESINLKQTAEKISLTAN